MPGNKISHDGLVGIVDHHEVIDRTILGGKRFQRLGQQLGALVRDDDRDDTFAHSLSFFMSASTLRTLAAASGTS